MSTSPLIQILKTRDDHAPVYLEPSPDAESDPTFHVAEGSNASWASPGETLTPNRLRERVEPWLTSLCQTEHLGLLLGSGLLQAVTSVAKSAGAQQSSTLVDDAASEEELSPRAPSMDKADFGDHSELINAEVLRLAALAGRGDGNIEDQLRVASELLRGFQIRKAAAAEENLRKRLDVVLNDLATSILEGERALMGAELNARELAFNYLVSFLTSFAARSGTRDRLHIFTTNYDRLIETGADLAGIHLLDRFVGALSPLFRSSRLDLDLHYNPPGIRGEPRYLEGVARFTKLHGSLDWLAQGRHIRRTGVPFGALNLQPYFESDPAYSSEASQLMIYPNAAKDRETAAYPYVDLFRDFAAAVCRPNTTLMTYGYGFGDEHINRVIEDMLTIPSTHLVVISYDDPLGRIMKTYNELGRHSQISLLIGNHFGSLPTLVDHYLPKPAIDRTSFRMAELLKARWSMSSKTMDDNIQSTGSAPNDHEPIV